MKTITKLLLVLFIGASILLAGCTTSQDIETPETNTSENTTNSSQEDPINETFEEDVADENDDVEIGELI